MIEQAGAKGNSRDNYHYGDASVHGSTDGKGMSSG
jgi:hypothetical protein